MVLGTLFRCTPTAWSATFRCLHGFLSSSVATDSRKGGCASASRAQKRVRC